MFDLENLNPAERYFYPDSPEEWIELRLTSDDDQKRFFKAANIKPKKEIYTDKKTRAAQILRDFEPTDEQMKIYEEELWDFSIVDWNLVTSKGDSIPCARENKLKMMFGAPKFAMWVRACQENMFEKLNKIRELTEKN